MADRLKFSLLGCLLIPVAIGLVAFRVGFKSYRQTTSSMTKTIEIGDQVWMRRWVQPKRGDIIAFDYPLQPNTQLIKRVVAMPGQTLEIRDKQLFIDGKKVDEIYAWHDDPQIFARDPKLPEPYRSRDQFGPAVVPADSYFVMGDNRDRSSDSRYWGTVPRGSVRGVAVLIAGARGFIRPR